MPKDKNALFTKKTVKDIESGRIVKRTIGEQDYFFPKLVNRVTCKTFSQNCIYCKHTKFKFYSHSFGKNYYQCEHCYGINSK